MTVKLTFLKSILQKWINLFNCFYNIFKYFNMNFNLDSYVAIILKEIF